MEIKTISELYEAVCGKCCVKMNRDVLEVLQKTAATGNLTLKLAGNIRLRPVQRLSDGDVLVLCKCLQNNKHITGLDLRFNNVGDEGAGHLAELLQQQNSALLSLDLRFNDIRTDGAKVLASSLQTNSSLMSLRLSGNKLGNEAVMDLVSMLQVNITLQELHLDHCDLDTQSVIAVGIVLKSNEVLRCVDVSRPLLFSLQEEWTLHFSNMLEVNCSLLELHLGKMQMSDSGMEMLSQGLKMNRSLRYLDLRCNRVTRDGVRLLAEVLKNDSALEVVDLSANRIEDEGAAYLSDAIASPGCKLKELSVISNNIRTDGLLSLVQAMKTNWTLTHIYIWGNHLEEPVCLAFRDLTSSGRLLPDQTDVGAYEVDGRVFLARASNSLRKRWFKCDGRNTNAAARPDS